MRLRHLLAPGVIAVCVCAARPARAQWNEDMQQARDANQRRELEQQRRRRLEDPDDPRMILAQTTSLYITQIGLRGGAISSRTAGDETGFALALQRSAYFDGVVNRRSHIEARVGESAGPEGSVRADVALGYRFDLDPWYGIFVRGGVRGRLYGNDRLSVSALEAPQAQVGFQLLETAHKEAGSSPLGPITHVEIAGRASAGLVSRAEVDTFQRHLEPTPAFGGHIAFTAWPSMMSSVVPIVFNLEYAHFLANDSSPVPIDDAVASLCVFGPVLTICANGEATWTAVLGRANEERRERILMYGGTLSVRLSELLPGSRL